MWMRYELWYKANIRITGSWLFYLSDLHLNGLSYTTIKLWDSVEVGRIDFKYSSKSDESVVDRVLVILIRK